MINLPIQITVEREYCISFNLYLELTILVTPNVPPHFGYNFFVLFMLDFEDDVYERYVINVILFVFFLFLLYRTIIRFKRYL